MTGLYSVIFVLLMLVDWSQSAMNGGIWAMTVNCIGLLICAMIFTLFSWKECNWKHYLIWLAIWLPCAIGAYLWWRMDIYHVLDGQFIIGTLNVGTIGVLVIRYYKEGIIQNALKKKDRISFYSACLWVVLTMWMCVSPQRSVWHLYYFAVFLVFYLAPVNEIQKKRIVNGALNGIIAGFFLLQILAYGFRPYDTARYGGYYTNCNMNALMYLVTYTVVLTRILYWDGREKSTAKKLWLAFYYVLAGGLLGFQIMTMTRTALIMDVVVTIVFGCVWAVRKLADGKRIFAVVRGTTMRVAAIGGLLVVLFPFVFGTVRYLPTILHHPVWFGGEYSVDKVHSFDPWDSDKYVEWEEFWEIFAERMGLEYQSEEAEQVSYRENNILLASVDEQAVVDGIDESEQSTVTEQNGFLGNIRLLIYREYLENLNILGHTSQDGFFEITPSYRSYHGHNVFIQMGFIYGIPALIIFILLTAVLGIRLLLRFRKNMYDQWAIFRGFVYLVFFGFGMLEMTWNTAQIILVLIFFTQKTLECKETV